MPPNKQLLQASRIVEAVRPVLAGNDPEVIGAALAELLAMLLAGHHPDLREEILTIHVQTVRDLIKPCEAEMFSTRPRPKDWPPSS